ncbi:MAG: hypothetical protein ACTIA2_16575 [Brevibacterium aurantiacum]|uniref:Uncharacterized protein n=1 Tax=Brevibacterium aurantiacum TaxID=273384 RepID=A0A2H1HPB7_BREAU|nr:hypothetical protein [Brevibacterium aurantiacum]AZT98758.1 hypothetical protein CXR27_18490 [Brevibacterium aurantiacum]SMX64759.1 hypothetical protein BAURA63_00449 [Brevibacterium aurantiacum]
MDALLLIDTDDASYISDENAEILVDIVGRTRTVGGVLIFASTKDELVDIDDEELSIFVPDEEDLVLRSEKPDVFDGIRDLAPGLHDMGVDRIVIAGGDVTTVAALEDADASDDADSPDGPDDAASAGDADSAEDSVAGELPGSVRASAMAALVCNFDVIVLSDAVIDLEGQPVTWLDEAAAAGAMIKKTADTWLRM